MAEANAEQNEASAKCMICAESAGDPDWVCCDKCNRWAHYSCVGVDDSIKERCWFCAVCVSHSSLGEAGKRPSAEGGFETQEKLLVEQLRIKKEQMVRQAQLERKRMEAEFELQKLELEIKQELRRNQIRLNKELEERCAASENEFLFSTVARETKGGVSNGMQDSGENEALLMKTRSNTFGVLGKQNIVPEKVPSNDHASTRCVCESGIKNTELSRETNSNVSVNVSDNAAKKDNVSYKLSQEQVATRKIVKSGLPKFNGDAEVWPYFIKSFEQTTAACGFSNLENLERLRECLTGEALEGVKGVLLLPESVPRVIEDLRHLFGQPERLLGALLTKIRRTPAPTISDLSSFVTFSVRVKQLADHLEASGLSEHLGNPLLVQELADKLPHEYLMEWVEYKDNHQGYALIKFAAFISAVGRKASKAVASKSLQQTANSRKLNATAKTFTMVHDEAKPAYDPNKRLCFACGKPGHYVKVCRKFQDMKVPDRLNLAKEKLLCHRCLIPHGKKMCGNNKPCNIDGCLEMHNPLLHSQKKAVDTSTARIHSHNDESRNSILFRMIPVKVKGKYGDLNTLALIDEGSSVTLVDQHVTDLLGIVGDPEPLVLSWTQDISRSENLSQRVDLQMTTDSSQRFCLENVRTVSELLLPNQQLKVADLVAKYPYLTGLPLKDYGGMKATILIGLDNVDLIAPMESRVGSKNEPIGVRSKIGWTVYGPQKPKTNIHAYLNLHNGEPSNQDIHDMIKRLYIDEEHGNFHYAAPESDEIKRARMILENTTKRVNGRFETGLLWRKDECTLPDSYDMATKRMHSLTRKLEKDDVLREKTVKLVEHYVKKGYAHLLTENDQASLQNVWYLPLGVVTNPKKPGKLRLVWDAAAKVNGISLNTELLKGPDMLVPLMKIICLFRERPIAFGGDIEEMYHQIQIRPEDKQAQRFLFKSKSSDSIQTYVMDVATFGATCSPSSAQFVKNINATEFANEYPEASAAIIEKHYVDDYFDSADTVAEAIKRATEVRRIHSLGGFNIRGWVSNSPEFMKALNPEKAIVSGTINFSNLEEADFERVLGISWQPDKDWLVFTTSKMELLRSLGNDHRPTKRMVLSFTMAQFDPPGYLSPITIRGKMLLQDIWRSGCNWDEEINHECFEKWRQFTKLMQAVGSFRLERSYFGSAPSYEIKDIQLHVFADAGENAYGSVAYFRAKVRGKVECSLIMSRTKVAPLKLLSIPRMELSAAVLGARLAKTVKETHSFTIRQTYFWIDSNVVLSWLQSDQRKYKQFVGFRIGEIMELSKGCEWNWIPTGKNIADCLTKWGKDPELHPSSTWVRGPEFLYQEEAMWPKKKLPPANTVEELRGHLLLHHVKIPQPVIDCTRISKWKILIRTIATVLRFISNCKRKAKGLAIEPLRTKRGNTQRVPLTQEEYEKAQLILIKQAQTESFGEEVKVLKRNADLPVDEWKAIDKSSPLYRTVPLLDEDNIIRMEGRLTNAEFLAFNVRFPIVLPNDHRITWMIVQYYHEKCGHAYRQTVKNELRQQFHIPHADAIVRKVAASCMRCKVNKCRPRNPRMAPLPIQRLTPYIRPFSFVGVDYLGPFSVTVGRRTEKRWIAIFTCLVVRAIHLEVTHSLTTQSCLMAIHRFVGRRGWPLEFFSDNGTNFRGASEEVLRTMREIGNDCADQLTDVTTKWNFNPPGTPHMGGVWERLVRSVKEALLVINDGKRLTDEILQTSIVEAEDMINSRPLTSVSSDVDEAEALTPNSFLRGESLNQPTRPAYPTDNKAALRDIFQRSQQICDRIWQRWIKEYVPLLNSRTKWYDDTRALQAGDLVYIVEGKNRKCWIRGVVEEPIVSPDGRVRSAWIRTKYKTYKRAVVNLAVLEIV